MSNESHVLLHLENEAASLHLAKFIAKHIHLGDILLLNGELGAGKTTFVRALVSALSGDVTAVHSPTYTLLHNYDARFPIIHIDAYRMKTMGDLEALGFFEMIDESIACIEWPNQIGFKGEGNSNWLFEFKHEANEQRSVEIKPPLQRPIVWEQ